MHRLVLSNFNKRHSTESSHIEYHLWFNSTQLNSTQRRFIATNTKVWHNYLIFYRVTMRNEEPLNRGYWSLVLCVIFVLVYKIHGITICCTYIRFLYLKNHHQEMCEQDKILLIIKYIFEWWIKHSYANNFVFKYIHTYNCDFLNDRETTHQHQHNRSSRVYRYVVLRCVLLSLHALPCHRKRDMNIYQLAIYK